ncbi:MAG: signal peptidase I [Arenicellales bacterium]
MDFALILFIALVITGCFAAWDLWVRRPRLEKEGREDAREPLLIEYSKAFFPVILIVFLLRSFVLEPFRIPSGSMLPTLYVGDFILVNKFIYGIRLPIIDKKIVNVSEPKRGDVMVFRFPHDPSIDYIKRVVGLPGDQIEYKDKTLYINGKEMPQSKGADAVVKDIGGLRATVSDYTELLGNEKHSILRDSERPNTDMKFSVPSGHYFVMGDNRDYSNDSRYWGFVPEQNIIGEAVFIWFSWDSQHGGGVNWSRIGDTIQ